MASIAPTSFAVQCCRCTRMMSGPHTRTRIGYLLPDISHGLCRGCQTATWDSYRAAHPEKHLPTWRTIERRRRAQQGAA